MVVKIGRGGNSNVEETIWGVDGFRNLRRGRQGEIRWAVCKCVFLHGRRGLGRVVNGNWWRWWSGMRWWLNYWDLTWHGNGANCWSTIYVGFPGTRMTFCSRRIEWGLDWQLRWCSRFLRRRYKTTWRLMARFRAFIVDDHFFVSFYLKNFVCHFTDDWCYFVWTAPKRMKFTTESLGSWEIVEEYHLASSVSGAMHFSVMKRSLTFLLTL